MAILEYFVKCVSGLLSLPLYSTLLLVVLFVISYRLIESRLLLTEVQVLPPNERDHSADSFRHLMESDEQNGISQVQEEFEPTCSAIEDLSQTTPSTETTENTVDHRNEVGPAEDVPKSVQTLSSIGKKHKQESTKPNEDNKTCGGVKMDHRNPIYFQVIFLGDSGVGKTSFMRQYCASSFEDKQPTTVCIDLMVKRTEVDGVPVVLHLWDTAGQERFRSITMQYLRKADCIVATYDVGREDTLANVRDWLTAAEDSLGGLDRIVLGVVANKSDLLCSEMHRRRGGGSKNIPSINNDSDDDDDDGGDDDGDDDDDDLFRYMCLVEGKFLAEKLGAVFGVCSSKTGRGISKFMKTVCRNLVDKWKSCPAEEKGTSGKPEDVVVGLESKQRLEKIKSFQCC